MSNVTPTGSAGFNNLKEARGFKGAEENKTFSQELILTREVGLAFAEKLQEMANKLHAQEIEKAKANGRSVRFALPVVPYKEMDDGSLKFSFRRKEFDGAPPVIGPDGLPFTGLVRKDNQIQVAFKLRPYVLAATFGVSLVLVAVKVLESEMSTATAAALFGDTPEATKPADKPTTISDLF